MSYITKKGYKNPPPHSNLLKISLLCLIMGIFTHIAFSQQPVNTLPDTGYVGVGTTNPSCTFHVVGASQISGNITVDSSITIADSARIDNNLRVNGHLFVGKNAYISDTTFSTVLRVNKITPNVGDSLIYFGDSTIIFNNVANTIYPSNNGVYKGIGLGSENAYTIAAKNAIAIGHRTIVNKDYSIVIGTGVLPYNNYLVNNISNSIMMGTNSNLPTIFISPANGLNTTGRVGIGTIDPLAKLQINASNNMETSFAVFNTSYTSNGCNGEDVFRIYGNGFVEARDIRVKALNWCDYVFEPDYKLMSIAELEKFIKKHKHLPHIPSEKEVMQEGISMADINARLLKQVEEQALYIIELNNRLKVLEEKMK